MSKYILLAILFITLFTETSVSKETIIDSKTFLNYPTSFYIDHNDKSISTQSFSDQDKRGVIINTKELEASLISPTDEITLTNFPVNQFEHKTLILKRTALVVDANTQWIRVTKDGEVKGIAPKLITFSGNIDGEPNSKVYINFVNDMLFAMIVDQYQEKHVLLPILGNSTPNLHIISSESVLTNPGKEQFIYDVPEADASLKDLESEDIKDLKVMSNTLMEADIAVEVSFDFYNLFKDYDKTVAYVTSIISLCSKVYENDLNTRLFVPYVIVQEDQSKDPYRSDNDIINRLYMMPDAWKNRTVSRSSAVLFTSMANQGGNNGYFVGGVSMSINTLCSTKNGYCVLGMYGNGKYPTFNYTWDVSVTAHELGHAFGSPHTHACYFNPPIDTCVTKTNPTQTYDACFNGTPVPNPGTIMSYCHLTNGTHSVGIYFHERNIPVVRQAIEKAKCLRVATQPVVRLLSPIGESVIYAGSQFDIRWTSAQVEYISIKYSTDGGTQWKPITSVVEATFGTFSWNVPKINTDNLIIQINDAYNPTVKDQSIIANSIVSPSVLLTVPNSGERFGQKETITLQWDKKHVDNVDIFFTSDGGSKWTQIASNVYGVSYRWDIPDIINSNCKIKITSVKDNSVLSESGLFSIGKEMATILSPNGGELICTKDTTLLKWSSEYMSKIYFEYSTDNGSTWKYIKLVGFDTDPISTTPQTAKWAIPSKISSDKCLLRASSFADKSTIIDVSDGGFTIDSCALGVEKSTLVDNSRLQIIEIVPNPVTSDYAKVTIKYNPILNNALTMKIVNEKGIVVTECPDIKELSEGNNIIGISLKGLAQGSYILLVSSGYYSDSYPLTVIR